MTRKRLVDERLRTSPLRPGDMPGRLGSTLRAPARGEGGGCREPKDGRSGPEESEQERPTEHSDKLEGLLESWYGAECERVSATSVVLIVRRGSSSCTGSAAAYTEFL